MKKIIDWIVKWLWKAPITPPPKEKPIRVMGEQVFNEYMVIEYQGQKINLHHNELAMWRKMSRKDKRAMARKFRKQVDEGDIIFTKINGKDICLKNKDYSGKAEQIKK